MIHVLIGTRAQLIKMAPVICEIERRQIPLNLILTGQHQETISGLLQDFGVTTVPVWLHAGQEISGLGQVVPWFSRCLWKLVSRSSPLPMGSRDDIILVHGDTFSTLLGALAGRIRRMRVGHVESGLRSHNVLHPFPEELTRLAVFRLTDIAFCPDAWSEQNLKNYHLKTVNTQGNTLLDGLRTALQLKRMPPNPMPPGVFGVISLHRFENIFFRKRFTYILNLLEEIAIRYPLVFVLHPATRRNLIKHGHIARLNANPQFYLWPRMGYFEFVTLLKHSAFVITDGGSNQEELAYLGKPTLLMRRATERQDGLGSNVVLSGYQRDKVFAFIDQIAQQTAVVTPTHTTPSPSAIVVDAVVKS